MSKPRLVLVHASWCKHCTNDPSMASIVEAFQFLKTYGKLLASMADLEIVCWQHGEDDAKKPVEFASYRNAGYPFVHLSTPCAQKTFCGGPEKEKFLEEAIYGDLFGRDWSPKSRQLLAQKTGRIVSLAEIQQRCLTWA